MKKEEEFDRLILIHERYILNYIYAVLGDGEAAKDVKQNTMEKAWKSFRQLKDREKAKSWLFAIARTEVKLYFRRKKSDETHSTALSQLKDTDGKEISILDIEEANHFFWNNMSEVVDAIIAAGDAKMVRDALNRLRQPYSQLIRMRYLGELSFMEIAQITGMNQSTVGVYIHRGLKMLKEDLEGRGMER